MKIAVLAPIAWRTPPRQYGPWEQVASVLTEGLVQRGVDVTLFATADSLTKGELRHTAPAGYAEDRTLNPKVEECMHISEVMETAAEFDLIHNHFDFLPLTYSRLIKTPMVTTIHGFSSPNIVPVYKKYNRTSAYVSISNSNRHPELDYLTTVYNGIDTALFPFGADPEDYLLYFGRIHPEKGAHLAIQVARQSGKPLILAGLIQDENYFATRIQPELDGTQIRYAGNVGPDERGRLLGNALALLHLIGFDEPFGLSVAEAMLCGTPVIAIRRGAMPELIADRKTGLLVSGVDEAVDALKKLPGISRAACREWAMDRFSRERMVAGYLGVYEQLLNR